MKLLLKNWITKVADKIKAMNDDLVHYDKDFTANIAAGTIGTRGAQVSFTNPMPATYYIRSIFIRGVYDSSSYLPVAFYNYSDNKFYVNFYRCTSSAVTGAGCSVRIVFTKSAWGGYDRIRFYALCRRFGKAVA